MRHWHGGVRQDNSDERSHGDFFNHSALVFKIVYTRAISVSVMPGNEVDAWITEEGLRAPDQITRDYSVP